ncbi:hypothetical protein DHEL01_v200923 [Diaporthe helianthi]|uniref:Uncharacterized protein n=1 Tax=Diaporthe helianthi TaxID=158607 RepID=A0A2P5IDV4_DIAHE|nr:hypothetical protein DHEL01_v200923 [Diaporthe helianthi]
MTGSRRSNEAFTICAKHSGVGKPSISSAQTAYVEASSSFKGAGKAPAFAEPHVYMQQHDMDAAETTRQLQDSNTRIPPRLRHHGRLVTAVGWIFETGRGTSAFNVLKSPVMICQCDQEYHEIGKTSCRAGRPSHHNLRALGSVPNPVDKDTHIRAHQPELKPAQSAADVCGTGVNNALR